MAHTNALIFQASFIAFISSVAVALTPSPVSHCLPLQEKDASQMYNGEIKFVRELNVRQVGKNIYSDVYPFGHKDADAISKFSKCTALQTCWNSLQATVNGKLVYKRAEDLKVGESLWELSQITEISKHQLTVTDSIRIPGREFPPSTRSSARKSTQRIGEFGTKNGGSFGITGLVLASKIGFFPCPRVMRWNNGRRIPSDESDHNAAAAATTGNKEPSINNACERAIDERSKALEIEVPRSPAPPFIQKKSFTKLPLVFARERYVPSLTLHMEEWEWSELSSQLSRVARLDTSKNTGTKSYALIIFLPRRLSGLQTTQQPSVTTYGTRRNSSIITERRHNPRNIANQPIQDKRFSN
ncbi:hypothetical protein SELMODRAFT_418602 [Selaginella moellendorffii]|uniref:LysM domain-containing protein n=1 Tax=Selaginella moellendorffii TaxID=88036 RepID=D8S683_SELML|nr:hypothetical protein SELMODRAFT_418602 [Selaginella moellendorffii]